MATITTHVCDNCSTEVERLYHVIVQKVSGYGWDTGKSPKSIDLCEPCCDTVLRCINGFFPVGEVLEYAKR